ncbi:permease [Campylobacter geochelonis]|uniref:Permease n=1 Tax=Campylobacter geochelonis TaxID=1780362 RepID=A0A128EIS5_9BACT|nr:permease [Campylobacter geochelonis]QKF71257.1 arsenic resistance permease [Campylobacter geochelonis]CZE48163.1 permease [Campylobacter geochelonis]CZE49048.1 permease [Campylobacter geochelonis]CZE51124.1 permease [Campylobacter geochelonis]
MWYDISRKFVYEWLNLSGNLGDIVHFFIYDSIKILALIVVIVWVISFLQTFINAQKVREYIKSKHPFYGYLYAAIFGVITPFCSCSAIPLFIGFLQARIPLGVTFTYLISAPMNNEVAIALLISLFGVKITLAYTLFGIVISMLGGYFISKLKLEKEVLFEIKPIENKAQNGQKLSIKERILIAKDEMIDVISKIYLYVLFAIAIGALIHSYIPTGFIQRYTDNVFGVFVGVFSGIFMYSNAIAIVPFIEALVAKGLPIGTALSFMMAVVTLSLPEFLMLKKIISFKLLTIFILIVSFGIITLGISFNYIF